MVYQVIYTSSASASLTEDHMRELAQNAADKNIFLGITGILLFFDGSILQVLEGEQAIVETLLETINNDTRHTGMMPLIARQAVDREFSKWSMGFRNVSGQSFENTLFKLSQQSLAEQLPKNPSHELASLTRTYAKVSGF